MKSVIYSSLIALIITVALMSLLWIFDVINEQDLIEYGKKIVAAILVLSAAAAVLVSLSKRGV